jgi:hypothetical protein
VILSYIGKVKSGELSYEQAQLQLVEAVQASMPAAATAP